MLMGTGRDAEPGIVGNVKNKTRPGSLQHHAAGEDRLIADRRRHGRQARHGQRPPAFAGVEAARHMDELAQAKTPQSRVEEMREVLPERHEVGLVVGADDRTLVRDDLDGVEIS
jgi:hypothetical protein